MNNNISLGNIYSRRIIIKRYYLSKLSVSKENLAILVSILSLYYRDRANPSRGSIKSELKFDFYLYADGYVLELYYNQIDNKKVDKVLKNSYLKTDLFLNDILNKKFDAPYILVTSKKRVLDLYLKYSSNSLNQLLSESEIKYSKPILDLNLINSASYDEVSKTISALKSMSTIQEITIDSNHNFLSSDKKKKSVYSFNYNLDAKNVYGNYDTISLGYILEFEEIESLKSYSILNIIFDNLKESISSFLFQNYKIRCNFYKFDISRIRAMIVISFKSRPILDIKDNIDTFINAFLSSDINVDTSLILFEKMKGTKLLTSYNDAVNRLKLAQDYLFDVNYDNFFYNFDIKINEIRDLFSSIKLIKNFNSYDDRSL